MRLILVSSVLLAATSAWAQCLPQWDTTIGNPGALDGYIEPMVIWNDGSGDALYVGGSFSQVGNNVAAESLARYDIGTGQWSDLGSGLASGFVTDLLPFNDGSGERLYVAGLFNSAGGQANTSGIAAWNGSSWASLGGGIPNGLALWALHASDFSGVDRLYIAGNFFASINGVAAGGIASWNTNGFASVGSGVGIGGSFSPYVNGLLDWDDGSGRKLYAVGRFDTIDGVAAQLIACFDGTSWSKVGAGLIAPNALRYLDAIAVFDDGNGEALYVGGTPIRISGVAGEHSVVKWDGTSWTPVGQNVGGRVTDLLAWDDGLGTKLYMAGTATPGINYLARLEGNQWVIVDGGVGGAALPPSNFPSVFGLATWGPDLLVGGNFTAVGGSLASSNGIVRRVACPPDCPADLNNDGTVDQLDLNLLLADFGCVQGAGQCLADLNSDGLTDQLDLNILLAGFGLPCP